MIEAVPIVAVPVERVLLTDGRTGVIRMSRSSAKFCRKNKLPIIVAIEKGQKEQLSHNCIAKFLDPL